MCFKVLINACQCNLHSFVVFGILFGARSAYSEKTLVVFASHGDGKAAEGTQPCSAVTGARTPSGPSVAALAGGSEHSPDVPRESHS